MSKLIKDSTSSIISHSVRARETAASDRLDIIEEPSQAAKPCFFILAGLIALAGLTFFFGLGRLALIGPDEPRYAEVAREMFATGDYISPRLCGCLWFEKPALLYWMGAGAYHLFGVNEFAARFPSAFSALAATLFLCHALRRAGLSRLGPIASLVLLTSGIFIGFARAGNPDMLLAAAMTLAFVSAHISTITKGRARLLYWMLCWAGVGAAVLAKGLVGVVFAVIILAAYFVVSGRLKSLRWRDGLSASAIFFAVAAVWHLPVIVRHGRSFIDEFFIEHHFQRYLTEVYGHPQPFYFFLFIALAGVMPWTFFLIPAAARLRSLKPRSDERDQLLSLAWIWFGVPLLFFTFSSSKLPGYLLPVFPALAIIIGVEVERFWGGERTLLLKIAGWMTALLLISIGVAFVIYLSSKSISPAGWQTALYWGPLIAAIIATASFVASRNRAFIIGGAAVVASVIVGSAVMLFPTLNEELSLKTLSLQAAAALRPGEKITFYIKKEFAPVFYAEGRVVCGIGEGSILNALQPEKLIPAFELNPTLIVITPAHWMAELEVDPRFDTEFIAKQRDVYAARVRLRPPEQ